MGDKWESVTVRQCDSGRARQWDWGLGNRDWGIGIGLHINSYAVPSRRPVFNDIPDTYDSYRDSSPAAQNDDEGGKERA